MPWAVEISRVCVLGGTCLLGRMSARLHMCIEDYNDIHGAGLPRGQKRETVSGAV